MGSDHWLLSSSYPLIPQSLNKHFLCIYGVLCTAQKRLLPSWVWCPEWR
jgi:hypothetical protein